MKNFFVLVNEIFIDYTYVCFIFVSHYEKRLNAVYAHNFVRHVDVKTQSVIVEF